MGKIQIKLDDLMARNPRTPNVKVNSGLRGVRYFIEFPIVGRNVDALALNNHMREQMEAAKKDPKYHLRITTTDSYLADENVAYLIDYQVKSSKPYGNTSNGSCYIRGVKGQDGWDSFKFILEKSNDFSDFDADLVASMYEKALCSLNT